MKPLFFAIFFLLTVDLFANEIVDFSTKLGPGKFITIKTTLTRAISVPTADTTVIYSDADGTHREQVFEETSPLHLVQTLCRTDRQILVMGDGKRPDNYRCFSK